MRLIKDVVNRNKVLDQSSSTTILSERIPKRLKQQNVQQVDVIIKKNIQKCPKCENPMIFLRAMDNDVLYYCKKCKQSHWLWE